jgi:predicted MPP superfamily phosphohydrolase
MANRHIKHPLLKGLSALLLLLALLTADSTFRPVTDEYELLFGNLPPGFDGLRIVQLSDLHGASFGKDNARLLSAVAKAKPEIIALTGDFIDVADDLDSFASLAGRLTELAPVYYVSGNHDWSSGVMDDLAELLDDGGIVYLRNEYIWLERGGDSIILCGVEDPNGRADMIKPDALTDRIAASSPDAFVLLLGHRNYWMERYPALKADLILCGHGNGGIIRLPFFGGLMGTGGEFLHEYSAGLYENAAYTMLVSRGLGNGFILPRFLNNPEIVALTLRSESGS